MNADTHRHNVTSTLLASFWWLFLTTCISVKHWFSLQKEDIPYCQVSLRMMMLIAKSSLAMIYGQSAWCFFLRILTIKFRFFYGSEFRWSSKSVCTRVKLLSEQLWKHWLPTEGLNSFRSVPAMGCSLKSEATSLKICHRVSMSFSHCCCYGFLSTPKPLPLNRGREVIHGDALKWLYQLGPKGFPEKACVVTSLPDWSEMKKGQNMSLKEYLEWFKKAHGALQFLEIKQ